MALLNRKDWVLMFESRAELTEGQARKATDALEKAIVASLTTANVVKIPGVGTLRRSYAPARSQFVAHLNKFYDVPASYNHSFRPVRSLKLKARSDAEADIHAGA